MIELGVLLVLALVSAWREWTATKDRDRMASQIAQERSEWTEERRELLNRIRPETAQHGPQTDVGSVEEHPDWELVEGPFRLEGHEFEESVNGGS